jgi:hypothetical protein
LENIALYSSENINRIIKSQMRWVWHVAYVGKMKNAHNILVGIPEWTTARGDLGVHMGIMFKKDF